MNWSWMIQVGTNFPIICPPIDRFTTASWDRTFKLSFGTTSGYGRPGMGARYGRYVKSLWGAPWRATHAMVGAGHTG